ncbi:MAG: hypothetical protein ABH884_01515 [Candidatus Komeilibacteria bacterium]
MFKQNQKKSARVERRFDATAPHLVKTSKIVNYPTDHRQRKESKIIKFVHNILF